MHLSCSDRTTPYSQYLTQQYPSTMYSTRSLSHPSPFPSLFQVAILFRKHGHSMRRLLLSSENLLPPQDPSRPPSLPCFTQVAILFRKHGHSMRRLLLSSEAFPGVHVDELLGNTLHTLSG